MHQKSEQSIEDQHHHEWFVRMLGVFGFLLFGFTIKLWLPPVDFPAVPMLDLCRNVPGVVDWSLLVLVFLSFVGMVFLPNSSQRVCLVGFALTFVSTVLLNQHRLQPWAVHIAIIALFLSAKNQSGARRWLQFVAVSIYLYAGIAKLDYQFVHTLGSEFVDAIFGCFSVVKESRSETSVLVAAIALPCLEIAVGILLCIKQIRMFAFCFAVLFHVVLISLLSPLGLNHRPPVLIWNAFFIVWIVYLFWPLEQKTSGSDNSGIRSPGRSMPFWGTVSGIFVLGFPGTTNLGLCDHWLGWEVYAPRSSRVQVEIFNPPDELLPIMNDAFVDFARYSLDELNVPIYPQQRFQIGIAIDILERYGLENQFRATLAEQSDRWTGTRDVLVVTEIDQLRAKAGTFRLNALPRIHKKGVF